MNTKEAFDFIALYCDKHQIRDEGAPYPLDNQNKDLLLEKDFEAETLRILKLETSKYKDPKKTLLVTYDSYEDKLTLERGVSERQLANLAIASAYEMLEAFLYTSGESENPEDSLTSGENKISYKLYDYLYQDSSPPPTITLRYKTENDGINESYVFVKKNGQAEQMIAFRRGPHADVVTPEGQEKETLQKFICELAHRIDEHDIKIETHRDLQRSLSGQDPGNDGGPTFN